jgi:hypothetical protein
LSAGNVRAGLAAAPDDVSEHQAARADSIPVEHDLGREGEAPAEPQTLPAIHFNEMRSKE